MLVENLHKETQRKDQLLYLFQNVEASDFQKIKNHPSRKFEKVFQGVLKVKQVLSKSVILEKQNGQVLGALFLPSSILHLLREKDSLFLTLAYFHQRWHLLTCHMIRSEVQLTNQQKVIHVASALSSPSPYNSTCMHFKKAIQK